VKIGHILGLSPHHFAWECPEKKTDNEEKALLGFVEDEPALL
jgi:hypothetical protein